MASSPLLTLCFVSLLSMALFSSSITTKAGRQVYVVYMGEKPSEEISLESVHYHLLDRVLDGITGRESMVHSYGRTFNGFAAMLTEQEQQKLAEMEGIVSVFPSKTLQLHTTRSWDFLGFPDSVKHNLTLESDVIVGMIDSGIWPESGSFHDKGLGPPPSRWKGVCQNITCNNKIIGARYYKAPADFPLSTMDMTSPYDYLGHGTHTASTVAGRPVANASFYGLAQGTARGAVPAARLAVYKVCWIDRCPDYALLAAFDDAIADGVDVISISIGGWPEIYFQDVIAIGSFHSMKKGILTVASSGNTGPRLGSVENLAPWLVSVGASTIDRHIVTKVVAGENITIVGASINSFPTENTSLPFMLPEGACIPGSSSDGWKGKILLCNWELDEDRARYAGARGAVFIASRVFDYAFPYPLPMVQVSDWDGRKLKGYLFDTKNPVANIHRSEAVLDSEAPLTVSFSARGPSSITPDILKPDISAPGANIIAAWSEVAPISSTWDDGRRVKYNIVSGTSMACPHVAGVAAYVKSIHPEWSPAAILSALVTTATPMSRSVQRYGELAFGAGQINPATAANPGLVYDAGAGDYAQMLCDQGFDAAKIRNMTGDKRSCTENKKGTVRDLNYPSIGVLVPDNKSFHATFPRTVTNVGDAKSRYVAKIVAGSGMKVMVKPEVLEFGELKEKKSFVVTVAGGAVTAGDVLSGAVIWTDGKHRVRSPVAAYNNVDS